MKRRCKWQLKRQERTDRPAYYKLGLNKRATIISHTTSPKAYSHDHILFGTFYCICEVTIVYYYTDTCTCSYTVQ